MMTTYSPRPESADASEARADWFDAHMPQWREMTNPDRFVPESAFPVAPAEVAGPTVEDWEAFAEANWSDPAELSY